MTDAITRYANKWGRERDNNFAVACYDDNTIAELQATGEPDEIDMANWDITDPVEWREAIAAALIDLLADDRGLEYAWDKSEGQVVYRIPGHAHGDGKTDTDDSPVWILGSEADIGDIAMLPEVATDDA